MRVESGALRSGADRLERVRDAVNPSGLPSSFAPAGLDPVSVLVSNRLAVKASETVTQLWSTYTKLDAAVTRLRGSAHGYDQTEGESTSALSGGGGGVGGAIGADVAGPSAVPTPAVTPATSVTPAPAATPEQLSAALHGGAGAQPVRDFAQQWKSFASGLRSATDEAMAVRGAVGSSWEGPAHDAADAEFASVRGDLEQQMGSAEKLGTWADTHATSFEDAARPGAGVPEPPKFSQWHQNLENAVAADAQFPGVYTPAVIAAQEELGQGYTQTGQAYGQYAVDPVTGELFDPATGLPIDPATGLPIADDLADEGEALGEGQDPQEMLSSGAQLLTGLLGGVVGGLGGMLGSVAQADQQAGQMAAQTVGQLAKGMSEPSVPNLDGLASDLGGLGAGDFGGGGGGGGGTQPSGGVSGPGVSTAGSPPPPAASATGSAGPSGIRSGEPGMRGMGMGGMPMMPMGGMGGGAGAGPASPTNPDASPDGKKLVQPNRPNTARVIGETSAERVESKRQRREQRMQEARDSAKEQQP